MSFTSSSVQAEAVGHGSDLDRRIQTAVYSADNVFRINAFIGRTSVVKLEAGETIRDKDGLMVMGDPNAWDIGPNKSGDMVAIKPKTDQDPNTNFIVNTNKRTYVFELKLVKNVSSMTYLLRFDYPKPPETPFRGRSINLDPCSGRANRLYDKKGDMSISPTEVWDNGTFTCMRFPTNAPRPVIYQVLPDGRESVINFHTDNDIVVIHGVSAEFMLRLNNLVLAIRSRVSNTGYYNYNGTTNGEIREVISGKK
jgi:type IV secretion system protein VirB9